MIGFPGPEIADNHPIRRDILAHGLGGVILFNRCLHTPKEPANIVSVDQVRTLCSTLQELSETELLIGIDQEGGTVRRLRPEAGFAAVQSAREMGAAGTEATAEAARITAAMLAKAGINCNFAPVVDVDRNPGNPVIGAVNRSFSADPDTVADHAATWIQEHRRQGIVSCVKHFPGHGSSTSDSHAGFVDISEVWDESELLPYHRLHRQQLLDAVMTGHLVNQRIDPDFPATLSEKTVTGILRRDVGFDGIVFSDDLQMRAITDRYGFDEAVCRALAGGVDILVFGNNLDYDPDICPKAIAAVIAGIEKSIVSEERLQGALRRVRHLKQTLIAQRKRHE